MRRPDLLHALIGVLLPAALLLSGCGEEITHDQPLNDQTVKAAQVVAGLDMTASERDLMRGELADARDGYLDLHRLDLQPGALPNSVRPAVVFDPLQVAPDLAARVGVHGVDPRWSPAPALSRPADLNKLAYYTVGQLGTLIRTRQVSCEELTRLSLERLRRYDPELHCVVTLTAERALDRARELDAMLARGEYLGPLHGIPYGAKDLLAVAGYPTTWGAAPYRDQVIGEDAAVIRKLDDAGAVLTAKLTLGALAMGDVWFGGKTRNPWNPDQGSSGSSAGPAAAVSAGLVPFAIGTETWGSIVSPSTRCGVTGLRPTFGRVSKAGAMTLSWTMDKIGPIARTVKDCAIVFDAIRGADPADPSAVDMPFAYDPRFDARTLRVGYLKSEFDRDYRWHDLHAKALDDLRAAGFTLVPVALPDSAALGCDVYSLSIILSAEAGAAFQELVLSGRDDELVRQDRYAWPTTFRAAQFIPAVQYIQANRARVRLMRLMADVFKQVDVYVTPSFEGDNLLITNLTGHPQVVVPCGFKEPNAPHSISFVGGLYDEAEVLEVARAYQEATGWEDKHPEGYDRVQNP